MYVNGLGFVNDSASVTNVNPSNNQVKGRNNTENTLFDKMLANESAKLNSSGSQNTYNLKSIFEEASEKYGVSYDMLTAIAWHESRFQPDVTSSAGAMGLMQLMPETAAAMGVTDGYDPYQNVMGAAKLLSKLSEMYDGNQTLTLAAYAAGTGSVAKYGGVPPYGETREFVSTITKILNNGGITVPDDTVTGDNDAYKAYSSTYSNVAERAYETNKNVFDKFYSASRLEDVLSYSDYQLLMYYFENMMEIISNIGSISDDINTNRLETNNLFSDNSSSDNTSDNIILNSIAASDTGNANMSGSPLSASQMLADTLNSSILTDQNVLNAGAIISGTIFNRVTDSNTEQI